MRKLSTREYVLLGFLAVVAVALFYFNRDARMGGGPGRGDRDEELDFGEAPVVYMDRLVARNIDYDAEGRNLFKYYTPPPQRIERPAPPPRREPPKPPPRPREVTRDLPPPSGPKPPPINFAYLGYLGPKDNKIAVFENGQEILLARAGDVVQQQFRVVEFGYESIVMGYVDARFEDETTELQQRQGAGSGGRRRGR